jgi:hypothetical protein
VGCAAIPARWSFCTIREKKVHLRNDEFAIGSLVRLGIRFGLFSHCIWVNDRRSLLGGRHIWGLPKEMANFVWEGDILRITDEKGSVATLLVNRENGRFPKVWAPVPAIGQLDGDWTFAIARLRARLEKASMHLNRWTTRFDFHIGEIPIACFAAKPFRVTMPRPNLLHS